MQDELSLDLPIELRLHGHCVQFMFDVTNRIKATCGAFPDMLVLHGDFRGAVRQARKAVLRLSDRSDRGTRTARSARPVPRRT